MLKALLPYLLMLNEDHKAASTSQTIPRDVKLVRDHAVNFVW